MAMIDYEKLWFALKKEVLHLISQAHGRSAFLTTDYILTLMRKMEDAEKKRVGKEDR